MDWIAVSDRLPEDDREVLVTDGKEWDKAYWVSECNKWALSHVYLLGKVTYWCNVKLPKKPSSCSRLP